MRAAKRIVLMRRAALGGDGGAVFSPLSLFTGSKKGLWYDPNDLTTMFQDTGGVTPAVAVNDPVRLIRDKSGNAVHATALSDAERPLLKQAASGDYYLGFDGTSHRLVTGAVDLSAASAFSRVTGVTLRAGTGITSVIFESVTVASTGNPGGNAFSCVAVSADIGFLQTIAGPSSVRNARTVGYTMPQTFVFSHLIDVAATGHGELQIRQNGVDGLAVWTSDTETGAALLSSQTYSIGSRAAGSRAAKLDLYGVVMVEGALAGANLTNLEGWMGGP